MEISAALKADVLNIQGKIVKAIQDHSHLALKLKDFPNLETQIKQDLFGIQRHIIELNDKQKILLQQLRKEIKEKTCSSGIIPVYNFNLYKTKPNQESKKSRRKDLNLAPKIISCRPTHSPPSLSPSPTPSSSSSLSDDSIEYVSPFMLPVPLPKPRPTLLPEIKENTYLESVSRRDLKPSKLKRNQKPLSDEEVFKDIPVYNDPLPSPPPTDEKDLKARFMTALSLIPKEMHNEILNRKVERKRRSTATNNPNFVYNNDWEIPPWKRSRTYLSPHKVAKMEVTNKRVKTDDSTDNLIGGGSKQSKKDREADNDKSGRICLDGLQIEKSDVKSRNSTPDSMISNMMCFVCHTSGLLNVCKDCNVCYHLSCVSPNSSISCPCCKNKRSSPDEDSSENSSKEEFTSKCPNVAESYNKLKEYIENHTDSDTAAYYSERESVKIELMTKNQELYSQKRELEEKAAELSEALLLQEGAKNNLLRDEEKILAKIKLIADFIYIYQKTNRKKSNPPESTEDYSGDPEKEREGDVKESKVEEIKEEKIEGKLREDEETETYDENRETDLKPTYLEEKIDKKGLSLPKSDENFDCSIEKGNADNKNTHDLHESPPISSKKRREMNTFFELEEEEEAETGEIDDPQTCQSVHCSIESEEMIEYESSVG